MNTIKYKIRLSGIKTPEGTIPLIALKGIAETILNGSERALRLSVEGASKKRGKIPAWLKGPLEITVTGISKGSTILEIEAPILLESAPEQVQQRDLWYTLPEPQDTSISIFVKSVVEAISENIESEYYDQGVLESLLAFKPLLDNYLDEIEVSSQERPKEAFRLVPGDISKIVKLQSSIKEPRAIILSGLFNIIEHAERRFQLVQEDGHKILGKAGSRFITDEEMREYWGKKVTVKGMAYFNASGNVRFIDTEVIKHFELGEQIFENISKLVSPKRIVDTMETVTRQRNPLSNIWGKWPGEESIEEILLTLEDISKED